MRVLGIDPGYAIVGWGVVDYAGNRFAPVDFGAVCTDAGVPFERRLDEVYAGIKEVIERTRPEVLAIEKLFYQHNQTTVIGVAEARGVILLAAAQAGLPIYEYTPMQVKQAVTGYGKAVKKQVQEMTRVPVDFGAVCTDAGVPFERRLDEVYAGIKEVIERTRPEVLAIEKLFYQHNQTTVIGVAEARGVILLAAAQAGLPIYEYTPMQVKQAVTGYGKAVKKQVQEMTRVLLHLPAVPKPDDTADALAMAITFCHTNGNQLNRFVRRVAGPI